MSLALSETLKTGFVATRPILGYTRISSQQSDGPAHKSLVLIVPVSNYSVHTQLSGGAKKCFDMGLYLLQFIPVFCVLEQQTVRYCIDVQHHQSS